MPWLADWGTRVLGFIILILFCTVLTAIGTSLELLLVTLVLDIRNVHMKVVQILIFTFLLWCILFGRCEDRPSGREEVATWLVPVTVSCWVMSPELGDLVSVLGFDLVLVLDLDLVSVIGFHFFLDWDSSSWSMSYCVMLGNEWGAGRLDPSFGLVLCQDLVLYEYQEKCHILSQY